MILQGRDIQPEPSEKVRSPENDFEYVSDSLFFIPENKARAHSGGPLFHKAGEHFACRMFLSKGFSFLRASFPNLDEQNKWLTLRTSPIIYFRGNMSNKKDSMLTISLKKKGIHVGSIMSNKKRFRIKNSCHKRHPFWGHFALKELASR